MVSRPAGGRGGLLAGIALGVGAIAGAVSAEANFVSPVIAAGLGMGASVLAFYGESLWEKRLERERFRRVWEAALMPGPAGGQAADPAAGTDSVLTALNPDQQVVPFSPLRGAALRNLLTWCQAGSDRRVWPVLGEAGSGKTRLLLEAAERLSREGWRCGWVRHGKAADAVAAAALQPGRVLLVVDDADTYPDQADLAGMLTALVRGQDTARMRVVLSGRDFGHWWEQIREGMDPAVHAALTPPGRTCLQPLSSQLTDSQQLFIQAVGRYARHFGLTPPAATLTGVPAAASLAELQAAAASTAYHGLSGTVRLDTALQRLFSTEEHWWQANAADWGLTYPLAVLQAALTVATLIGADDSAQMARRLHCLPGLTAVPPDRLTDLALWLHQLYPQRGGQWLDPHLPARLAERYAVRCAASQPALPAALAAAALTI